MATKKSKTSKKATKSAKKAGPAAIKPIKDAFTKASLASHLADHSGVQVKDVKQVLASLEATMMASLHPRGKQEFTLPGLLKIVVNKVPAKKRRFGVDPFTKEERWFDAKPASVRLKARTMKKLKDAAI
ncbi:MAG: HU family DNA-binding protein [Burkholderiaceae bacterium]